MTEAAPITRALISVSDKTGAAAFARALAERGVALVSSGGTAAVLRDAGLAVTEVAEVTGLPEMLGGRVKTLHPRIHGGILARRDRPEDMAALARHGIAPIDLVAVNLYPFAERVASGADPAACIEAIDIGGPALIRAAAKAHPDVVVATSPRDYDEILDALTATGGVPPALRRHLAARAFAHTAAYDAAIADWFATGHAGADTTDTAELPATLTLVARRDLTLRYGENPHQAAALYHTGATRPGVAAAHRLQGKALSYNNLQDADAAFELVAEFDRPAIAIIKHANPCGVAEAEDLATAFARARTGDPVSAFGGIVAANRPLDGAAAAAIARLFVEVVIAPEITDDARAALAAKTGLRLLATGALPDRAAPTRQLRTVAGGVLVQTGDAARTTAADLTVVTVRAPTDLEIADLLFADRVAKHVRSNAIVLARAGATIGVGAGQMSRVDSVRLAVQKATETQPDMLAGCVCASDAFFPFPDGVVAAAEAGATAVIQPGGSMRDGEVIAAADACGIAMVVTGLRHFRH